MSPDVEAPLQSAQCPQIDHPSNFQHESWVSQGVTGITCTNLWRAAIIVRAKKDPLRTLCVLTSSSLEDFRVLALLDSARVVLDSSKVSFAI